MKIISKSKTSNYDLFAYEKGNRDYKDWWAAELAKKISEKNMLIIRPAVCIRRDGKLFVIDGQHRIGACKKLGIPVPYEVVDGVTPEDIAVLNANQRGWGTKDFLHHFVELGKRNYIEIQKFIEETGFAVSVACSLCQGRTNEGGQGRAFRNGDIRISPGTSTGTAARGRRVSAGASGFPSGESMNRGQIGPGADARRVFAPRMPREPPAPPPVP